MPIDNCQGELEEQGIKAMESRITIMTEDRRFSLRSEKTVIDDLFCEFVMHMIGHDMAPKSVYNEIQIDEESNIPGEVESEVEPDQAEGVTGFLYLECEHCGYTRGLHAKIPLTSYVCGNAAVLQKSSRKR